jgi:16S rRNA (cytosine967-C5)-methyltransferase
MASGGVWTVAADVRESRIGLVAENVQRLNTDLSLVVSDGCFPPFKPKSFNRVLVDAPCSGLGVLRRRADARWRVSEEEIERLSSLQEKLLLSALNLVAYGGQLIYSVCTVTSAETTEVDERFRAKTGIQSCGLLPEPWRVHGQGGMILPQDLNSEGMAVFRYQVE